MDEQPKDDPEPPPPGPAAAEVVDGPTEGRIGKSKAMNVVRERRAKVANILKFNALILARRLNVSLWQHSCEVTTPLQTYFNETLLPAMKNRWSSRDLRVRLCGTELQRVALQCLINFESGPFKQSLELTHVSEGGISPEKVEREKLLVNTLWRYCLHIAGAVTKLSQRFRVPPECFCELTDPGKREASLGALKAPSKGNSWNARCGTPTPS